MKKETQVISYNLSTGYVQFDYPIAFDITMHKKGNKYVKKTFVVKLYQINGKDKINNGRVAIDFSQIPIINKPIVRRDVILQNCSDKAAVICISVKLEQTSKSHSGISNNKSPNSSLLSPNSSLVIPDKKKKERNKEKHEEIKNEKLEEKSERDERKSLDDPLAIKSPPNKDKITKVNQPKPIPVEIHEEIDELYQVDGGDDSFSSRMSFSDLILHPKESELSSESSSSEEEAKELPQERLVAHSMPKTSREEVTPNENSKGLALAKIEEKNGIATKREGNCCATCDIY